MRSAHGEVFLTTAAADPAWLGFLPDLPGQDGPGWIGEGIKCDELPPGLAPVGLAHATHSTVASVEAGETVHPTLLVPKQYSRHIH